MPFASVFRTPARTLAAATIVGVLAAFFVQMIYFAIVGFGYGGVVAPVYFAVFYGPPVVIATFVIMGALRLVTSTQGSIRTAIFVVGGPLVAFASFFTFLALYSRFWRPLDLPLLAALANLVAGAIMAAAPAQASKSWLEVARAAGLVLLFLLVSGVIFTMYFLTLRYP